MKAMPCLCLLAMLSCDAGGDETSDTGARACDEETRGMTFSAGMEVMGEMGLAKIQLLDASPAPPIRDYNDWRLVVMDPAGDPLPDVDLSVTPWMPDHGHGSPNKATALIRAVEAGAWDLQDLDLFMPGYWEVHFDIELPSSDEGETGGEVLTERVTYGFCVD